MYCQARWATAGIDDTQTVDAVLQVLNSKEFYLAGQQGAWLNWLKKDLKDGRPPVRC